MGFGYVVDLNTVSLSDTDLMSWIMAAPLGSYNHPKYGKINFDSQTLQQFADSVNNKVRETDLDIDYDHKMQTTEAAGWVKQAEVRNDGLWILVEWTKKAYGLIKDKAFRYFSPEFVDKWKHPKSGEVFSNVLCGGGITNRPFLKDIAPINLSEFMEEEVMTEEQFRNLVALLGLGEDASVEDVFAKIKAMEDSKEEEPPQNNNEQRQENPAPQLHELNELIEKNPALKNVVDLLNTQNVKMSEMSKKLHDAEVNTKLSEFMNSMRENKVTVSPVAETAMKQYLSEVETEKLDDAIKLFSTITSGIVPIGESGAKEKNDFNSDDVKIFSDAVDAYMKSNEVDYATAVISVSTEKPELAENYRKALI